MFELYNRGTGEEDRATQGCDPSACFSAGMRAGNAARPSHQPHPPTRGLRFGVKDVTGLSCKGCDRPDTPIVLCVTRFSASYVFEYPPIAVWLPGPFGIPLS